MSNDKFQILHISDLHISADNKSEWSKVLDALIARLKTDSKEHCLNPEIVVVSGDIAFSGVKKEYDLAKVFFDKLLENLGLTDDKLFLVPGNHDVDMEKYLKSEVPVYKNMDDLNNELKNSAARDKLFAGMSDYFDFVKENYPHLSNIQDSLVPFVNQFKAKNGKKIGIVGLNSAWMCRKLQETVAIGEYQVKTAMDVSKSHGNDITVVIFHHPLSWLWKDDRIISCRHFKKPIFLIGHLHEAEGSHVEDYDVDYYQFQSGGAYTEKKVKSSSRFQHIEIDWNQNIINLNFRKFNENKWNVDIKTGKNGNKKFDLTGFSIGSVKVLTDESIKPKSDRAEKRKQYQKFTTYLKSAVNEHRFLPTKGFETNFRHPIEIEQVYINMRGYVHGFDHGSKQNMGNFVERDDLSSLDIKAAFNALKKRNIKDMAVLGDPGSGKTTLLKYILLMFAEDKAMDKFGIEDSIVPFFASLRELKDSDKEKFEDFMIRECKLKQFGVTKTVFKKLLENGDAVILLDGLDEVSNREKRLKTCSWIDDSRKRYADTKFIITSRFAGYTGDSRLEGGVMELSIQDFTPDEVKAFLLKWFQSVEVAIHPGTNEEKCKEKGWESAEKLAEVILKSEYLLNLAKNPLILQIIALVHKDRGVLPQRRVELYVECVNVLLEKWDTSKGLDVLLSAREARCVLQPVALWLQREVGRKSALLKDIVEVIKEPLEEIGRADINPEELLINIRDRSGVFTGYSESEYGFAHLSFQEYLAAEQIRNRRLKDKNAIKTLVDNYQERWWREVILLCLALDNPSVIEEFMEKIIKAPAFKDDIALVQDAIKDSIIKPLQSFINAIKDKTLDIRTRQNVARVLNQIGGDKAIAVLKESDINVGRIDMTLPMLQVEITESQSIINKIDGSEMVLIPACDFIYGSREDDKIARSNEKPQKIINLANFYIDKYPVTNSRFCKFLNTVTPGSKELKKWIKFDGSYEGERCRIKLAGKKYRVEDGFEYHPVIYVSWFGADAYAKWSQSRLPSELEWEKAARGADGIIYPWGNEFDKSACNSRESVILKTTPVDKYDSGESVYGVYDMSGNVWEWTKSIYKEYSYNPDDGREKPPELELQDDLAVVRGGGFFNVAEELRCASRYKLRAANLSDSVGFRVALSPLL